MADAIETRPVPAETVIKGRTYTVTVVHQYTGNARADMLRRGWEGTHYMLTGKRGAVYGAYRSAATGEFSII